MHLCMQIESEVSSKYVIGIWGLHKRPSTHLGLIRFHGINKYNKKIMIVTIIDPDLFWVEN
jgi:hypothetical protein